MSPDRNAPAERLRRAFLEDHRHFARGLREISVALKAGDAARAAVAADKVDRVAGPHIEFEETVFYPELRAALGDAFVEQLYDEHDIGQTVVRNLMERPEEPLAAEETERLQRDVDTALEHVHSCGTLLSHLEHLDESRQEAMLETLLRLRTTGHRWTDKPGSGATAED